MKLRTTFGNQTNLNLRIIFEDIEHFSKFMNLINTNKKDRINKKGIPSPKSGGWAEFRFGFWPESTKYLKILIKI